MESKFDGPAGSRRSLAIPAGEARSVDYFIVPLKVGYLPIKCTARSTQAADAVIRPLLVEVGKPVVVNNESIIIKKSL